MPRLPFQTIHPKPAQYNTSTVGRKDDAFNAEKLFSIVFRVCNEKMMHDSAIVPFTYFHHLAICTVPGVRQLGSSISLQTILVASMMPAPQIKGTKSTPAIFHTDKSGPSVPGGTRFVAAWQAE